MYIYIYICIRLLFEKYEMYIFIPEMYIYIYIYIHIKLLFEKYKL